MKTVVAMNAKGGAGKTTATFFIAQALARAGYRVQVCDIDGQQASFDWLRLERHAHPNLTVSIGVPAPSGDGSAQPDIRIIDTEGKSQLATVLRVLPPTVDMFLIPTSTSSLDLRQMAYTGQVIARSRKGATIRLLWCRLNLQSKESQPDMLDKFASLSGIAAFSTPIALVKAYASMNVTFDALKEERRLPWEKLAAELAHQLGIKLTK